MFRRLLPLMLVPLALSACSPGSSESSGSADPSASASASGTDQALVDWLDEYCGLPALVTQDVRAPFDAGSVPDPVTEADRAPLVAALTAADASLAEVDAAAAALLPAPEVVGDTAVQNFQRNLQSASGILQLNIDAAAITPPSGLSSMYTAGGAIFEALTAEGMVMTLPYGVPEVGAALLEAPNCATAAENL